MFLCLDMFTILQNPNQKTRLKNSIFSGIGTPLRLRRGWLLVLHPVAGLWLLLDLLDLLLDLLSNLLLLNLCLLLG